MRALPKSGPRLTAFGEDFAARGFQMALDESPRDTVATGDAQLLLMRNIPLAIRLDAYVRALGASAADTDFPDALADQAALGRADREPRQLLPLLLHVGAW